MAVILFLVFPLIGGLLGYLICTSIFDLIVGKPKYDYSPKTTFIDNSVHHHYTTNQHLHLNGNEIPIDRNESTIDNQSI